MKQPWRLLLLPGDGIGPEVVEAARPLMERASWAILSRTGRGLHIEEALIGGAAWAETGSPLPEHTLARARESDAVLLGAVGGPRFDQLPPENRPEAGLLALRRALQVFANLRPAWELPGDVSPLRKERRSGFDVLLVRELTGGLYYGEPRWKGRDPSGGRGAVDTMTYQEAEIRRVARVAFMAARGRRRRVTSVDKANVLACSRLWREIVDEVAVEFPDVELQHQLVDSAAMRLVLDPGAYDVILTENMFGDILSDLIGGVAGELGALPSASLGDGRPGLFEPVHGSAPDLVGRDRATPAGVILSFGLVCRYVFGLADIDRAIREATRAVMAEEPGLGTRRFGEAVADRFRLYGQGALT
jgi:3-isopropylmalate dehydrogenase